MRGEGGDNQARCTAPRSPTQPPHHHPTPSLATKQIVSLLQESQTAFSPEDLEKLSTKLSDCVKRAQVDATKGKRLLDVLKTKGEDLAKTHPKSDRLQPFKSQYMRLCKSYVDTMKEHQRAKETMRKSQLDTVVRRATLAYGGDKTEAELREMAVADPQGLIREAIMMEGSEEAQAAYSDAQSRARDVETLVRCVTVGMLGVGDAGCCVLAPPLTPPPPLPAP